MLKQKLIKVAKDKKGFGTILVICVISLIIPLLMFVAVDIPYYLQQDKKLKSTADNIAASTATIIDENKLADGVVAIDKRRARAYLLEELALWFRLEDTIYDTEIPGVKLMKIQDGVESMMNINPAIIEITPDMEPITDEKTLMATRVEYFIHTDQTTATYRFTDGQKVQVSTPTVGIMVSTITRGVIFRWPVRMIKVGMTEVYFNPNEPHPGT